MRTTTLRKTTKMTQSKAASPEASDFVLKEYLERLKSLINSALKKSLETYSLRCEPGLFDAVEYALLGQGKRIRGILTLASCSACGGKEGDALPPAIAIEYVHAYSLVHDDLPAMDDDDMRRGKPTVHKQFDEATAILVGDALLTEAFGIVARWSVGNDISPADPEMVRQAMVELSDAAGVRGMVSGQAFDLKASDDAPTELLEKIHYLKTGALFGSAAAMGAISANSPSEAVKAFREFGRKLGLAFQIADDIFDEGDPGPSYCRNMGKGAAKEKALNVTADAKRSIKKYDDAAVPLNEIADYVVRRAG